MWAVRRSPRHDEEADSRFSQLHEPTSKILLTSESKRYEQSQQYLVSIRWNAKRIAKGGRGALKVE